MQTEYLIEVEEFCSNNHVEAEFVSSLQQSGLIEITYVNNSKFIDIGYLRQLEKLIRLYYELDINLEGIEAITYLLKRIETMQVEIIDLRNRLLLYESNE